MPTIRVFNPSTGQFHTVHGSQDYINEQTRLIGQQSKAARESGKPGVAGRFVSYGSAPSPQQVREQQQAGKQEFVFAGRESNQQSKAPVFVGSQAQQRAIKLSGVDPRAVKSVKVEGANFQVVFNKSVVEQIKEQERMTGSSTRFMPSFSVREDLKRRIEAQAKARVSETPLRPSTDFSIPSYKRKSVVEETIKKYPTEKAREQSVAFRKKEIDPRFGRVTPFFQKVMKTTEDIGEKVLYSPGAELRATGRKFTERFGIKQDKKQVEAGEETLKDLSRFVGRGITWFNPAGVASEVFASPTAKEAIITGATFYGGGKLLESVPKFFGKFIPKDFSSKAKSLFGLDKPIKVNVSESKTFARLLVKDKVVESKFFSKGKFTVGGKTEPFVVRAEAITTPTPKIETKVSREFFVEGVKDNPFETLGYHASKIKNEFGGITEKTFKLSEVFPNLTEKEATAFYAKEFKVPEKKVKSVLDSIFVRGEKFPPLEKYENLGQVRFGGIGKRELSVNPFGIDIYAKYPLRSNVFQREATIAHETTHILQRHFGVPLKYRVAEIKGFIKKPYNPFSKEMSHTEYLNIGEERQARAVGDKLGFPFATEKKIVGETFVEPFEKQLIKEIEEKPVKFFTEGTSVGAGEIAGQELGMHTTRTLGKTSTKKFTELFGKTSVGKVTDPGTIFTKSDKTGRIKTFIEGQKGISNVFSKSQKGKEKEIIRTGLSEFESKSFVSQKDAFFVGKRESKILSELTENQRKFLIKIPKAKTFFSGKIELQPSEKTFKVYGQKVVQKQKQIDVSKNLQALDEAFSKELTKKIEESGLVSKAITKSEASMGRQLAGTGYAVAGTTKTVSAKTLFFGEPSKTFKQETQQIQRNLSLPATSYKMPSYAVQEDFGQLKSFGVTKPKTDFMVLGKSIQEQEQQLKKRFGVKTKQDVGVLSGSLARQDERFKDILKLKDIRGTDTQAIQIQRTDYKQLQKQESKYKQDYATKYIELFKSLQVPKTTERIGLKQKLIGRLRIPVKLKLIEPKPKLPVFVFPLPKFDFKPVSFKFSERKPAKGFDVFVSTQKGFKELIGKGLTERSAFGLGIKETAGTAKRTFEVLPSSFVGKPKELSFAFDPFKELKEKYRKPVKKGKTLAGSTKYIEKTKYAIDLPGELREITYKGIQAKKNNPFFSGSLFGSKKTKKKRRSNKWKWS